MTQIHDITHCWSTRGRGVEKTAVALLIRGLGSNPTMDKILFILKFSLALRSSQLDRAHTNLMKYDFYPN